MPIDAKRKLWLDRFFPGLLAQVTALGPGDFQLTEDTSVKWKCDGPDHIRDLRVGLRYVLDDGHTIEIRTRQRLKEGVSPYKPGDPIIPGTWERYRYSLDYSEHGGDCLFRFDLDKSSGHHVHFKGDSERLHTPATQVVPDTRDMDPRDFVKLVAKFRTDANYPIKRKPR